MSFWDSELGEVTGNTADAFAKSMSFKQIPDGTMATAKIESFLNDEYQGFKFLTVNWVLTDGDFRGAKVAQKLKVIDADPRDKDPAKTRHRGLNMMKLMYQLFNLKPKHANAPTNDDLSVFVGREAGIKVRETEPNIDGRQYNWVAEIHDKKGFKSETGVSIVVTHVNQPVQGTLDSAFSRNTTVATGFDNMTDDIPF
jgi:hypothetical protein